MANEQQKDQGGGMRDRMPRTARWIDERRAEFGREWVDDCIRRSMKGAPDLFYAIEDGHTLGTPFTGAVDPVMLEWQALAIVAGTRFAGFIARPAGGAAREALMQIKGETSGAD